MKRALIFGVTGQDGSYLADLLLTKGYEVHGVVRRASTINTSRVDHLHDRDDFKLHYGDICDNSATTRLMAQIEPHEVYNLAAQSHVKVSFEVPISTVDSTAMGALKILESVREVGLSSCRIYQASSSEMFGSAPSPQRETTPFHPRSPYGCAKVFAYHAAVNYREAYGMHISNGILFNHTCVADWTPVIIRQHGLVNILPIEELVPHRSDPKSGKKYTTEPSSPLEVWDRQGWTKVKLLTASWIKDQEIVMMRGRNAVFTTTSDHKIFVGGDAKEVEAGNVRSGDQLSLATYTELEPKTKITSEEAWLLGALVADGWVGSEEDGHQGKFGKEDESLRNRVADLWEKISGGWARVEYSTSPPAVRLNGAAAYLRWLRPQLYTKRGLKRVPLRILNADREVRLAFLQGYNACDGLKGGHCSYEFKSFTTNSPTLAQGLWWLSSVTLGQRMIVNVEDRDGLTYFHINLNSSAESNKDAHLRKPPEEVISANRARDTGWVFDLETESSTFQAGVGRGWIHNSPRRGETFVCRKITRAVGRILVGTQKKLVLGNLNAERDWGWAPEYVEGMWLMLQQDSPGDYVLGTGVSHSVGYFVKKAFEAANLEWQHYVEIDEQRYARPTEVDILRADTMKARRMLGWQPKVTLDEIIRLMVKADTELANLTGA